MKNLLFLICFITFFQNALFAHCDSMDGPVIKDARAALESKNVAPALKWVKKQDENRVTMAFNTALAERAKSPQVKQRAEMKFFETLVAYHRLSEGMKFTGVLKPAGSAEPVLIDADKALESGAPEVIENEISARVVKGLRQRFDEALEKRKHMNESVQAGREYVKAYIEYSHYVEHINQMVTSSHR